MKDIETLRREELEQRERIAQGSPHTAACRPGACVCKLGKDDERTSPLLDLGTGPTSAGLDIVKDAAERLGRPLTAHEGTLVLHGASVSDLVRLARDGLHHGHVDRRTAGTRAGAIAAGHSVLCAELGTDRACSGPDAAPVVLLQALSLYQPWLDGAILLKDKKAKRVENREAWRSCSYRGPLLLHAADGYGGRQAFDNAVETILNVTGMAPSAMIESGVAMFRAPPSNRTVRGGWWEPGPDLVRGAIVGRCRLDGEITCASDFDRFVAAGETEEGMRAREAQGAWWRGGFALVLADVERLVKPVPYKGHQRFFKVDSRVLAGAQWERCE